MGYTTDFEGQLKFNKELEKKDREFLRKLNHTRRMARNLGPEYGVEGEFFVDGGGGYGQDRDDTIIDYNRPPSTQPGLWCQWTPVTYEEGSGLEPGDYLEWDGGEKFYNYVEWLQYIIKLLEPKGYKLNGEIEWFGEDRDDRGRIVVKDNDVKVLVAKTVFEEE